MKIYRILFVASVSLLFLIMPVQIAKSECGVGNGRAGKNYSFVHAENFPWQSDYAPYLMGYGAVANYYAIQKRDPQEEDNIGEWRGRFCNAPDSSDIDKVLYDSPIDEIADLRQATASKSKEGIYYQLQKNTFAQVIQQGGCTDVVDYLLFAKTCEKYCVKDELWSEKPTRTADMFQLINRGRDEFKHTKAPFLKLRYAYQMVRLAHYAKDYKAVLQIYDDVMPKMERINSIINYWILAHKAGAMKALGQRAEAAYLFAVVFRYSPSKRRQAFESFDIRTEGEWQTCLSLCKSDKERAALFAIRASYDKSKAFEDLMELHQLDPKNEHLEMLLVRETLRLEKILLGNSFRKPRYEANIIAQNKAYCLRLRDFVKAAADQNSCRSPVLWRTTEGYLTLLLGDWQTATRVFAKARILNKDNLMGEQIDAFDLAARITALQGADAGMNDEFEYIRKSNSYLSDPDFEGLFLEKLGSIYNKSNDPGVAFLCNYDRKDLEKNPQLAMIDNLINLCKKPEKSIFEKELTTFQGKTTIESQLWDVKGRYHLAHFELESAVEAFRNIPELERGKKYTPFVNKIIDRVNSSQSDSIIVNKFEFAQKMLDMEYQIKVGSNRADSLYFLLGLGYYNMTFFGNSSSLADFYRSGSSWKYLNSGQAAFPLSGAALGNHEVLDVSLALQYFEKARQLTPNRDFQAQCAFWCAKCEQNIFYTSKECVYKLGSKNAPNPPPQYRRYFKLLKDYYSDTKYYQQAATECKYLGFYARK